MFTDSIFTGGTAPDSLPQPLSLIDTSRTPQRGSFACGCDRAAATLATLHAESAGRAAGWAGLCQMFGSVFRPTVAAARFAAEDCPRVVSAPCGALLFQLARLGDVRLAVMLGVGDAAAAIWLACALRANHRHSGDRAVIACEPAQRLSRLARCRLLEAGVSRYVDLRQGPFEPVLEGIEQPVDCLLFNGYPALMLPMLKRLQSRLRPGASVVALRCAGQRHSAYLRYVRDPRGAFTSIALPCPEGVELSVRR